MILKVISHPSPALPLIAFDGMAKLDSRTNDSQLALVCKALLKDPRLKLNGADGRQSKGLVAFILGRISQVEAAATSRSSAANPNRIQSSCLQHELTETWLSRSKLHYGFSQVGRSTGLQYQHLKTMYWQ